MKMGRWKNAPRECEKCGYAVRDFQSAVLVERHDTEIRQGVYHLECLQTMIREENKRVKLSDFIKVKQLEIDLGVL